MAALSKTLGVASVAALLAFGASDAFAQSPPAPDGPKTIRAGKDGRDGMGWRAARFIRIFDTDDSGNVSLAEIQAEQKRIAGAADVDGDGVLSVEEFLRRGRLIGASGPPACSTCSTPTATGKSPRRRSRRRRLAGSIATTPTATERSPPTNCRGVARLPAGAPATGGNSPRPGG